MKKVILSIPVIFSIALLGSCSSGQVNEAQQNESQKTFSSNGSEDDIEKPKVIVTDSKDNTIEITKKPERVITIGDQQTKAWIDSNGEIIATTADAFENVSSSSSVYNLGNIDSLEVNKIISMQPNLVIMPSNISEANTIYSTLKSNDIEVIYSDIDSEEQYLDAKDMFAPIID